MNKGKLIDKIIACSEELDKHYSGNPLYIFIHPDNPMYEIVKDNIHVKITKRI